jgi:hypothetical protein
LLRNGQSHTNDHRRPQRGAEYLGPVPLLLRGTATNVGEFAFHLAGTSNPPQHGPGLIHVPAGNKPARAVGNEQQADPKGSRWNRC